MSSTYRARAIKSEFLDLPEDVIENINKRQTATSSETRDGGSWDQAAIQYIYKTYNNNYHIKSYFHSLKR